MLSSDGSGGEADGKCEGDAVSPVEKYGSLDNKHEEVKRHWDMALQCGSNYKIRPMLNIKFYFLYGTYFSRSISTRLYTVKI